MLNIYLVLWSTVRSPGQAAGCALPHPVRMGAFICGMFGPTKLAWNWESRGYGQPIPRG